MQLFSNAANEHPNSRMGSKKSSPGLNFGLGIRLLPTNYCCFGDEQHCDVEAVKPLSDPLIFELQELSDRVIYLISSMERSYDLCK